MTPKPRYKNVTYHKQNNRESWLARIVHNGVKHHIGYYPLTDEGERQAADDIEAFKITQMVNYIVSVRDRVPAACVEKLKNTFI